ncbi:glycosyltransferase [Microcoleus sp. FACHB-672]|uniref:glycosyltransferase n=1 Tax=Microcoleus sp. FACHB-672 TaxID=2692825 RepID=UPI001682E98E|nr:glycosyltransferase [Microcoleus sp. FACHB-672]MBD2043726.1 glycosyltransferase [Microcoleus sp. FACHB-672]
MSRIGVVTIGRNEGERLVRCLNSLKGQLPEGVAIVYVDSGSTDGSCEAARNRGVEVVDLDMSVPFTAARARNAGFERLQALHPEVEYVHFFDGDCEVVAGWIEAATEALDANPEAVAICGWRRERYAERSLYNRICDVEWRMGAVGETGSFGGDVAIRAAALAAVGGYDNNVIAAEDDELSVRLREAGGKILRIDRNSTVHDADMQRLSQWWQRAKRCGYAYAQVSQMHGAGPERKFVKEMRRTWLWGAIIPFAALVLALPTHGLSLILLGRYPLSALQVIKKTRQRGYSWSESVAWGLSCGFSAIPGAFGVAKYFLDRWGNKQHEIIEYKGSQTTVTNTIQPTGR